MKFFEALDERRRLQAEGYNAVAVECIRWDGGRNCVVFKDEQEEKSFRQFNKDWDIKINRLA
jgi:hypothetical protein